MSADDDLPPDLEDLSDQVAAMTVKATEAASAAAAAPASNGQPQKNVSRDLLRAGDKEIAPEVAERLLMSKLAGSTGRPKTKEELEKSEFLTDWGSPDEEAMQKQMIDAALAAAPEVAKEKQEAEQKVTKGFMKGTAVKKGFLLGGGGSAKKAEGARPASAAASPSTAKSAASSSPAGRASAAAGGSSSEEVVVLKPTADPKSSLRLSEVQEALQASAPAMQAKLADGKWMTPDLFERIKKEPRLMLGLQNPRWAKALDELMKNPGGGMEKYAGDAGLQDFLRTFMGVLGEHFTELGKKEEEEMAREQAKAGGAGGGGSGSAAGGSATAGLTPVATRPVSSSSSSSSSSASSAVKPGGILGDDRMSAKELAEAAKEGRLPGVDEEVRQVLANEELVATLRDPAVQKAMEECRQDGRKLRAYLADPAMRRKFAVLNKAGLIRIEGM